ncbi:Aldehyde/histidinol dehydrogenase [Aspergillus pseudoustus]|uniref:Aldehyde/histidinol dehydrogenase n=1 Tax=Aspergillus pseudoustus TaxID=1810923 RepID=A0ABR4IPV5_9EURO
MATETKNLALGLYQSISNAHIEGRLDSVLRRQRELYSLHVAVKRHAKTLADAIQHDTGSHTDALVEIHTTLHRLREIFKCLDFPSSLEHEYLPEYGKDVPSRRSGLGAILVLPGDTLPVSQTILPIAYCLAAGNPVLAVLSEKHPATTSAMLTMFETSAIDRDVVALCGQPSDTEQEMLLNELKDCPFDGVWEQGASGANFWDGGSNAPVHHSRQQVIGGASGVFPCIVSRNADLQRAAKDIALANLVALSGQSPAAANVILVDEFVLEAFCAAVRALAAQLTHAWQRDKATQPAQKFLDTQVEFVDAGGRLLQVDGGAILVASSEWRSRSHFENCISSMTMGSLTPTPVVPIFPVTSMEAAMSLACNIMPAHRISGWYIYASDAEARYITSALPAHPTFVNGIPYLNLWAPVPSLPPALMLDFLSKPCPISMNTSRSGITGDFLFNAPHERVGSALETLIDGEMLEPPKQRSGAQVGFFEQGGRVGLAHLLVVLGASLASSWWAWSSFARKGLD